MTEKLDLIEAALKQANTGALQRRFAACEQAERKAIVESARAKEECARTLRVPIRKAKEWFRRALVPHGMGGYIDLSWASDSEPVFNYKDFTAQIYLRYRIRVFGFYFESHFSPNSKADCQAEGWRIFGVVVAMLAANITRLPEDLQAKVRAAGDKVLTK